MSVPAISPDSRWLAAGYKDTNNFLLYIWNLQSGEIRFSIPQIAEINSVDFSPNGRYLVSGGDDGLVRFYDPRNGKLVRTLTGFTDSITDLRFSADSSQIVITVKDQPAQVYDLATGKFAPLISPKATPDPFLIALHQQGYADGNSVLFCPDGSSLAIGSQSIQLWDIKNQQVIASLENLSGILLGVTFSPDGKKIAGITQSGEILIWNASSGEIIFNKASQLLEPGQVLYASGNVGAGIGAGELTGQGIAFSPDGEQLAYGNGNTIEIWDIANKIKVTSLVQPMAPAFATRVSFSPDGNTLYAVINRNRDVQAWNIHTGKLIKRFDLPAVDFGAFTATALNSKLFARNNYAGRDYWIELWNLETGEMLKLPTLARETEPLRFSPDGSLLMAISGDYLCFWETDRGRLVHWIPIESTSIGLAISPDNATLAIGKDGKAQLWDISALNNSVAGENFKPAFLPPTSTPWGGSDYDPTSTPGPQALTLPDSIPLPEGAILPENTASLHERYHFGAGTIEEITWAGIPGEIMFLTAGSQGVFTYSGLPLRESAYLPTLSWGELVAHLENGEILAAGVINQSVQVWNLSTGKLLAELPGFSPVRLNRTGSLLVYGDDDSNLRVYDLVAKKSLVTLYSLFEFRLPVFSPDNRLVAAVNGYEFRFGADHFVSIWDIETGKIVNAVGGPDGAITDLSFSADGQFIIGAAGGSAWIWDVRPGIGQPYQRKLYDGEIDGNLILYHKRVTAAVISPNNRLLAIGDSERNVWLYEISSGRLVFCLQRHAAPIARLRFSPDGTRLLSADADGQINLWNVSSGKAVESLSTHHGPIKGVILGLDDVLRAWGKNTVWSIRPTDGVLLDATSVYSGTILAVSPAGDWLVTSNYLHVSVWDAKTGEFGQQLEGEAGYPSVDHMWEGIILRGISTAFFNPDGQQLTTKAPGETWKYALKEDNHFHLLDYQASPYYLNSEEQSEPSVISSDGSLTAQVKQYWGSTAALVLSDQAGKDIISLQFPEGIWITTLAFNPSSRLIAVGQNDGSIALIDVAAWKIIATFLGHRGKVSGLIFSADGRTLISASEDGTILFWGVEQ